MLTIPASMNLPYIRLIIIVPIKNDVFPLESPSLFFILTPIAALINISDISIIVGKYVESVAPCVVMSSNSLVLLLCGL